MISFNAQQASRYYDWLADAYTTHPAFARSVDTKVLPRKLQELTTSDELDQWLAYLENALRAMRSSG